MATFKVNGARMGGVFRAQASRMPAAVRAGLREGAERGRTLVKRKTPVDLGTMRNAWLVKEQPYGASLDNSAPYAGIIEAGARPHGVSEEGQAAIRDWVIRNVPLVMVDKGKRAGQLRKVSAKSASAGGKYEALVDRVVKAIVWKLMRRGRKGKFIVRDQLETLGRWANQAVKAAVRRELDNPPR